MTTKKAKVADVLIGTEPASPAAAFVAKKAKKKSKPKPKAPSGPPKVKLPWPLDGMKQVVGEVEKIMEWLGEAYATAHDGAMYDSKMEKGDNYVATFKALWEARTRFDKMTTRIMAESVMKGAELAADMAAREKRQFQQQYGSVLARTKS